MNGATPRLPSLNGTVIGFGHRGARLVEPENTLASFTKAIKLGATGLETDAWVTADGAAVLDHDGKVGPRLRRRPIAQTDSRDLPDHIPTLDEFYKTVGVSFPLSIDVKDPAAFEPIVASARRAAQPEQAESNLWLCSPDLDLLRRWRSKTFANLVLSTSLPDQTNGLERLASDLVAAEVAALNLFHTGWSGGRIALVHRFEIAAFAWGVVHERDLLRLINTGIDALYSDHVERMVSAIDGFHSRDPSS